MAARSGLRDAYTRIGLSAGGTTVPGRVGATSAAGAAGTMETVGAAGGEGVSETKVTGEAGEAGEAGPVDAAAAGPHLCLTFLSASLLAWGSSSSCHFEAPVAV